MENFCWFKMFVEQIPKIILLVTCVTCASVYPPQLGETIVGGFVINITQAPWQVSLQVGGAHFCGGSIISENWIATAARCTRIIIRKFSTNNFQVRVGSSYRNQSGELIDVKRIIQNEKFSDRTIDYDFSLLELEEKIKFDATKQPIELHNFDEVFPDNTTLFVSGWGHTKEPNESSVQLRGVEVPLVSQKKCKKAYSRSNITPRMICAGFYKQGGKDACQGDNGGPLVGYSLDDGKPHLVGIVSWAKGCGLPKNPHVYSRILAARDWIYANTGI